MFKAALIRGLIVMVSVSGVGCASASRARPVPPVLELAAWARHARFPVAPVALPNGGLLYGERLTGRIRSMGADGTLEAEPIATLASNGALNDQRGLLGLARMADGRVFASWTRAEDGRLVVGEVTPGSGAVPRLVWVGPQSANRANGGSLVATERGDLLVGVGDLLGNRALADDPRAPNRKLLALDPDGRADQLPRVLSTGWNNPYAVTATRAGVPWVADNSGGRAPERIGRGNRPANAAVPLTKTPATIAPAGIVALGEDRLGVCGFVSRRVDEYRIRDGAATPTGRRLAAPCSTGTALLADGRLVTLTETTIYVSTARVRLR